MHCETVSSTSAASFGAGASYTVSHCVGSNSHKWLTSGSYSTSISTHCCVCSGVCYHVNGPFYCATHDPNNQTYTYPSGGGTSYPGTYTLPCPNCGQIGVHVCSFGVGTGTSPGSPTVFPFVFPAKNCEVCDEELSSEDQLAGKKICHDCRHAIEVFKTILVEEKKDEK